MSTDSKSEVSLKMPYWYDRLSEFAESVSKPLVIIGVLFLTILVSAMAFQFTDFFLLAYMVSLLSSFFIFGFLALTILNLRSYYTGWIGLAIAMLLKIAAPTLLSMLASWSSIGADNFIFRETLTASYEVSFYYIIISIFHLLFIFITVLTQKRTVSHTKQLALAREAAKAKEKTTEQRHVSIIPKCWEMTRCRQAVRDRCPNYIDHKTCWKRRCGCFCDREFAGFLVVTMDKHDANEIVTMHTAATGTDTSNDFKASTQQHMQKIITNGSVLKQLRARMKRERRPWKLQKRWCHECPLFMEHQSHKYRNFNWIGLPITGAIAYSLFSEYDKWYKIGATALENGVTQFTSTMPMAVRPTYVDGNSLATSVTFEWILFGVLFIILLSYIISFTDTMLLKWKV